MFYLKFAIIALALCLFGISSVRAETYKFHPGQPVALGSAYSPRAPFEDKGALGYYEKLAQDEMSEPKNNVFNYANIEIQEVKSISELYDRMNLSAKAGAHYGAFTGKASLNVASSLDFSENSVVYVFTGVIKFAPQSTRGSIKLTEAGSEAFKAAKVTDPSAVAFFNAAGSEIVTQIARGSSISVIYRFRATSREKRDAIKTTLDAKWAGGTASVDIEKTTKAIDRGSSFTVNAYQFGGVLVNATILSMINNEPGNVPEIRKIVQAALEKTTRDSSPIIEFTTASVHSLPVVMLPPAAYMTFTNQIDQEMERQYNDVLTINRRIQVIQSFLNMPNTTLLKKGASVEMSEKVDAYNNLLKEIMQKSFDIVNATNVAMLPTYQVSIPNWSPAKWIVEDYVEVGGWGEKKSYTYTGNEHGNTEGSFWPVLRFKFPSIINYAILRNKNTELLYLTPDDIANINLRNGSFEPLYRIDWSRPQHYAWGGDIPWHRQRFLSQFVPTERKAHENDQFSIEVFTHFGSSKKVPFKNIYADLKDMPAY